MSKKQIVVLVAVAIFGPALIGAIFWGISVATSDVRGQGNAARIQNDAQNRMQSEKEFNELYGKVQERDRSIDTYTEDLTDAQGREEEDLDFYRENLRGAVTACVSAVTQYNTLADNPQKSKWRPANLPELIDQTDPAFDCKASRDLVSPPAPAPSN